jgi:hypothetical protein
MTFKKEGTDEILPYWIQYFEKLNTPVPEGMPGVNPTGLSRSEKLIITKMKEIPRFARNDKFFVDSLLSVVIPNKGQRSEKSRRLL